MHLTSDCSWLPHQQQQQQLARLYEAQPISTALQGVAAYAINAAASTLSTSMGCSKP